MYKQSFLVLFMGLLFNHGNSQVQPPRLIVRGDDMGFSHSGNEALIKSYKQGIEKSIEVIVPSPWFPEAVALLREHPEIDAGVHLAITSEWNNVKWRPLSDCKSIRNADGYFYPMINHNDNYPGQAVKENAWKIEDIEKEFRAQIELALKKLPRISHISSHMGCTSLSKDVEEMTQRLAKEYKIDINPTDYGVESIGYKGPHATLQQKITSFTIMLLSLQPGKTYLFLDHPGLNNAELQAIYHKGYENVAEDRQGVTDLFTNEQIKNLIREKGIQLISYKDLEK